jgi:hypothetical protein
LSSNDNTAGEVSRCATSLARRGNRKFCPELNAEPHALPKEKTMFLPAIIMLIVLSPLLIPAAVHVCHAVQAALQTVLQTTAPAARWNLARPALAPAV